MVSNKCDWQAKLIVSRVITDMGGANAVVKPEDSVSGMIKVVEGLTPSSELKLRAYDGSVHNW